MPIYSAPLDHKRRTAMLDNPHALLPIAFQAAARVVRSRLLAEEASERALHLLTLAVLQGDAPSHPKAWLRSVARRSACALLRSDWARTTTATGPEMDSHPAPYRRTENSGCDFVRDCLPQHLSSRQAAALTAAVSCNTTAAAAKRCGMQPRDFRRSLSRISRKARRLFADHDVRDTLADDAAAQFQLDV
jgi:DNA-directed RNA polymerase specialized sigma24 family protein